MDPLYIKIIGNAASYLEMANKVFGITGDIDEVVEAMTKKLALQAQTFNMSAREAALFILRQADAADVTLENMKVIDQEMIRMERRNELERLARKVIADNSTELEKYSQTVRLYHEMLAAGVLKLDMYQRAMKAISEDPPSAIDKRIAQLQEEAKVLERVTTLQTLKNSGSLAGNPMEGFNQKQFGEVGKMAERGEPTDKIDQVVSAMKAYNKAKEALDSVNKAEADKQSLISKGKALTVQYSTAQEQFNQRVADLNELRPYIGVTTYNRALDNALQKIIPVKTAAEEYIGVLQKQIEEQIKAQAIIGGMSKERYALSQLSKDPNNSPADLRLIRSLIARYEATAKVTKEDERTKEIIASLTTEMDKYNDALNKINVLENKRKLTSSQADAARAALTKPMTDVEKYIEKLQEQADAIGKTKRELELLGISYATLNPVVRAQIDTLHSDIDARTKQQTLVEDAKKLIESLRSTQEKNTATEAKYKEMLDATLITQPQYTQAVAKLSEEKEKGWGVGTKFYNMLSHASATTRAITYEMDKGLKSAIQGVNDAHQIGKTILDGFSRALHGLSQNFYHFATSVGSGLGALGGFTSAIGSSVSSLGQLMSQLDMRHKVVDFFNAFGKQDIAERQLKGILELNKREVGSLTEDYKSFAEEIQRVTTFTDQNVLRMLAQAEAFGLTGDKAKAVVKNAISMYQLAGEHGGDPLHFVRLASSIAEGNYGAASSLRRVLPALAKIKNPTELTAKLQQTLAAGFKLATEEAGSATGQIQQLANAYTNLKEVFGSIVAKTIEPFISSVRHVIEWITNLNKETKVAILVFGSVVSSIGGIIGALAILKTVMTIVFPGFNILATIAVLAVAAITTGITSLVLQMRNTEGGLESMRDVAVQAVTTIRDWFISLIDQVRPFAQTIGVVMVMGWKKLVEALPTILPAIYMIVNSNLDTLYSILKVVGGIAAAVISYKLLAISIGLVAAILIALKIPQIASLALWAAWVVTATSLKIVLFLFNIQMVVLKFTLLALKGVVWLLNASLTVTNILLGGIALIPVVVGFIAFASAIGVVVSGIAQLWAYLKGSYDAGRSLVTVFSSLPDTSSFIAQIIVLFDGWWDIIKGIVKAAQVDLPLAWKLTEQAAMLAFSQIKDLWPPLWNFLKAGFSIVWELVTTTFNLSFKKSVDEAMAYMKSSMISAGKYVTSQLISLNDKFIAFMLNPASIPSSWRKGAVDAGKTTGEAYEKGIKESTEKAASDLEKLLTGIKLEESPETKALRDSIAKTLEELKNLAKPEKGVFADDIIAKLNKASLDVGAGIGKKMGEGFKSQKFDAVLVSSAEALTRLAEYADIVIQGMEGKQHHPGSGKSDLHVFKGAGAAPKKLEAVPAGGGDAERRKDEFKGRGGKDVAMLVEDILEVLKTSSSRPRLALGETDISSIV